VPTICTFSGIVIRMFFNDHEPPHIHVLAGGLQARIAIANGEPIDGSLPSRAVRMVREWTELRRAEQEVDWGLAQQRLPLRPIEPLP
jgi:hypothetical protein